MIQEQMWHSCPRAAIAARQQGRGAEAAAATPLPGARREQPRARLSAGVPLGHGRPWARWGDAATTSQPVPALRAQEHWQEQRCMP